MQPVTAITNTTHFQIDTVLIWNDGERNIAYAYQNGRVLRTMPLADNPLPQQIDEIRATFGIADGQTYTLAGTPTIAPTPPATQTASLAAPGPSRWN